jgi:hypothetical protein
MLLESAARYTNSTAGDMVVNVVQMIAGLAN